MTYSVVEFYQNRKGYNMAIVIPGAVVEPNPNNIPTEPEPTQPS